MHICTHIYILYVLRLTIYIYAYVLLKLCIAFVGQVEIKQFLERHPSICYGWKRVKTKLINEIDTSIKKCDRIMKTFQVSKSLLLTNTNT